MHRVWVDVPQATLINGMGSYKDCSLGKVQYTPLFCVCHIMLWQKWSRCSKMMSSCFASDDTVLRRVGLASPHFAT